MNNMQIQVPTTNVNKSSVFSQFSVPAANYSEPQISKPKEKQTQKVPEKKSASKSFIKRYKELQKEDKKKFNTLIKTLSYTLAAFLGSILNTTTDAIFTIIALTCGIKVLQKYVNSKFLVNFLNKRFNNKLQDFKQFENLAEKMKKEHNLDKKNVKIFITKGDDAYYTTDGNKIVVGEELKSALFHELGHAVIENNTRLLSILQNGRGQYNNIALLLNTIMMGNTVKADKNKNKKEKQHTQKNGIQKFLQKYPSIIPLIAFSPELITEIGASTYGLKFLKKEVKSGNLPKKVFNNILKSYLTCFSTYFFIPVSIVFVNHLNKKLTKTQHLKIKREQQEKDGINTLKIAIAAPVVSSIASIPLAKNRIAKNGRFSEDLLNKICDQAYKKPEKLPQELKDLHKTYLSNIPVFKNETFRSLLTNPEMDAIKMIKGFEILTAKELLIKFKNEVEGILYKFYSTYENKMYDKQSYPKESKELYKFINKAIKQHKKSFIKRTTLKSTGVAILAMVLFNKFKYLSKRYEKYKEKQEPQITAKKKRNV